MALTRRLPVEHLRGLCVSDGVLYWKYSQGRVKAGDPAGTLDTHGYLRTGLAGSKWFNHHIIYWFYTGKLVDRLDHKDGNPLNNRFDNLRECCDRTNQYNRGKQSNNTSGYKGVSFHKVTKKYRAVCNGKHLGTFNSPEEASQVYESCALKHNGEFYRKE